MRSCTDLTTSMLVRFFSRVAAEKERAEEKEVCLGGTYDVMNSMVHLHGRALVRPYGARITFGGSQWSKFSMHPAAGKGNTEIWKSYLGRGVAARFAGFEKSKPYSGNSNGARARGPPFYWSERKA